MSHVTAITATHSVTVGCSSAALTTITFTTAASFGSYVILLSPLDTMMGVVGLGTVLQQQTQSLMHSQAYVNHVMGSL